MVKERKEEREGQARGGRGTRREEREKGEAKNKTHENKRKEKEGPAYLASFLHPEQDGKKPHASQECAPFDFRDIREYVPDLILLRISENCVRSRWQ